MKINSFKYVLPSNVCIAYIQCMCTYIIKTSYLIKKFKLLFQLLKKKYFYKLVHFNLFNFLITMDVSDINEKQF